MTHLEREVVITKPGYVQGLARRLEQTRLTKDGRKIAALTELLRQAIASHPPSSQNQHPC